MLHPKKIFYFAYASSVDPVTFLDDTPSFLSVMRAVLPSYTCVNRLGKAILRKHPSSHVQGNLYAFTKEAFHQFEASLKGFEKQSLYVMVMDTHLLQEAVIYKSKS